MLIIHCKFYSSSVKHGPCSLTPSLESPNTQREHTLLHQQISRSYWSCSYWWGWTQWCSASLPMRGQSHCSATVQPQVFPSQNTPFFPFCLHQKEESASPTASLVLLAMLLGKPMGRVTFQEPVSTLSAEFPIPGPAMALSASSLSSEGKRELEYVASEALTGSKNCFKTKTSLSYPNHAFQIETFFTVTVYIFSKEPSLESFPRV